MRSSRFIAAFLLMMLASVSCNHIDLHDPVSSVYLKLNLKLNTDIVPGEDTGADQNPDMQEKIYGKIPETVRVCFYSTDTQKLVAEEFLPPEGGFIDIPSGTYDIIVYSLGTEVTSIGGTEGRGSAYAYTSEMGATVRITTGTEESKAVEDYKVVHEPDHIFAGTKENVNIPVHSENEMIVIDMDLSTLLETYSFEVKYIADAGKIQKADIYITGQSPSKYFWGNRLGNKACAIYFESVIDEKKGNLYTIFNTFGKFPNMHSDVYINVLVTDMKGSRYQWIYDVTDQFDNPDNVTHEIIIEDPIVIPEGGDGFTHDVNQWDGEVIYVPL